MEEKNVEVTLSDDVLTIKGEKTAETEKKEKNTYLSERCYGAFQRSFVVPEGVDERQDRGRLRQGRADGHAAQGGAGDEEDHRGEEGRIAALHRISLPIQPSGCGR